MACLNFEDIPPEILRLVASFFDRESVSAFALANRRCNAIANVFAFRTVSIDVYDPETLGQDVDYLTAILDQRASFRHVRCLTLRGRMYPEYPETILRDRTKQVRVRWNIHVDRCSWGDLRTSREIIGLRKPDSRLPQVAMVQNNFWVPLATFLCRLPALRDLVYACSNQVPPCLLSTLHEKLSNCRLHIRTFAFRSLNQKVMDPHELALARSPCLHSVMVPLNTPRYRWPPSRNYVNTLLLRIPLALAPNLQEATVYCSSAYAKENFEEERARSLLRCLPDAQHHPTARKAKLNALTMRESPLELCHFEEWCSVIDFSVLRVLRLEACPTGSALNWATESSVLFQSLTSLVLKVPRNYRGSGEYEASYLQAMDHNEYDFDLQTVDHDDIHLQTASFLRSLPPLKKLRIIGYLTPPVRNAIFEQHGPSLHEFIVTDNPLEYNVVYDSTVIDGIRRNCPRLTDLCLSIPRSKSDTSDMAIYQTLGMIPRLQTLQLTLNCSIVNGLPEDPREPLPCDPSFDEFDRQFFRGSERESMRGVRNGHIRDALIRSAIDENLARSIFQCISAAKASCSDPVLPLENLILRPTGADFLAAGIANLYDFRYLVQRLSCSWRLERKGRSCSRGGISVWQIHKPQLESELDVSSDYKQIFQKLWPDSGGPGRHWYEGWHSWPLPGY